MKWHLVMRSPTQASINPDFQGKPSAVSLSIGSTSLVFRGSRSGSHRGEKVRYSPFNDEAIGILNLLAAAPDLAAVLARLCGECLAGSPMDVTVREAMDVLNRIK